MITGTVEQQAIWEEIQHGTGHIIVDAGAGVGKTFTIVEGANRDNGNKKAFLAFNKSIATELGERLPNDVEAKTFHALGFAALRAAGIKTKVNNFKVKNIIDDILGRDFYAQPLVKLISLIKGSLTDAEDTSSIHGLIDEYNVEFKSDREEAIALANIPAILNRCMQNTSMIDFDDMIWLPLVLNMPLPTFDTLFVDEAQDFNEMQRELISRCVGNGRCIIVGDPNQAIYGFRGADSNSMNMFSQRLENGSREIKRFSLSLTWRCPKSVVAEANRYVTNFNCRSDAEDGNVMVNAAFTPLEGDMVLCRYNAPLVSAFYDLILQGKSAYILGRDMTKGLINAVKKITSNERMGSEEFIDLLKQDYAFQYNKLVQAEKFNQANNLEDKHECLLILSSKADTVGGIIAEIKRVFDNNDKGEIMLSTVHKAKGLEADNVYILATERMPHPKATNPKEERNICYVAITRAKKNLFYCGPKPRS
jgi:DNA helicase II / ATP-dependent DNA helicase PcrA